MQNFVTFLSLSDKQGRGTFIRIYNIYKNKKRTFVYMLRIAGQTAGPIGLKFFVETMGGRGVLQALKEFSTFF